MDNFIEYQRFPTIESAVELIDILEENDISYRINDSLGSFDIAASSMSPFDKQVVVFIEEENFEKVNLLFINDNSPKEDNTDNDHYLYSFSDEDIIEVIANPEDWAELEVTLAKQIVKQRDLKITAEAIKSARKERFEEQLKVEAETKAQVSGGYSWFLWIGILSIINSIDILFHNQLFFIFGLGITPFIDSLTNVSKRDYNVIGLIINVFISSIFIFLWIFAKRKQRWAFLFGMILYGLDTLLFVIIKDWWCVGFHVFVLTMIYYGIISLNKKKENLDV